MVKLKPGGVEDTGGHLGLVSDELSQWRTKWWCLLEESMIGSVHAKVKHPCCGNRKKEVKHWVH